jgi:RimJ/RimL family protein N-acetyltransferase
MAAPDFFQPVLTGDRVELRPLVPEDWDELYAVASDPLIWELHPADDRWQEPVFRDYFDEGLASGGALAIVDRATGRIIGASRYYGHDPERDEVEIGWTFLARACWGGSWNREIKRLMVNHILQFVGNAVFDVGEHNYRSQAAMVKIGGVLRDEVRWRDYRGKPVRQLIYEIREPMA